MTETTMTAVLSTLVQVAATLAALIGFLGLWQLDQLNRAVAQTDLIIRALIERADGLVRTDEEILAAAKKLARSEVAVLTERERFVQGDVQRTLTTKASLQTQGWWIKYPLVVFLACALVIFLLAFVSLVQSPQPWGFLATRCFLYAAGIVLMGSTLAMLVLMML